MPFSDFKSITQVIQKYPLKIRQEHFLPDIDLQLPDLFMENLVFLLDKKAIDESEAFLSEAFIFPFLQQVWQRHDKLKLWSHRGLNYDDKLFGEPDYFISALREDVMDRLFSTPLLAVAEAKKQDFEAGWGQCLAEMIACQKINQNDPITIYGIVTTGLIWEFAKLESNTFTKHSLPYAISDPQRIFGILDFIFSECERQIE